MKTTPFIASDYLQNDDAIIAYMSEVERDADNDAIYSCGSSLARRIFETLSRAGLEIRPKART